MKKTTINFNEIGYKAKSKHELYRIFVTEDDLYLPPEKEASMLYISQIVIGDKEVSFIFIGPIELYFIDADILKDQSLQGSTHKRIEIEGFYRVPCWGMKWIDLSSR